MSVHPPSAPTPSRAIEVLQIEAVVIDDDTLFSLEELCRACGTDRQRVRALVQAGVLAPLGERPQDWRFPGPSLRAARTALRLSRDLAFSLAGAAIVLDLLAEIDALRARLPSAGGG